MTLVEKIFACTVEPKPWDYGIASSYRGSVPYSLKVTVSLQVLFIAHCLQKTK